MDEKLINEAISGSKEAFCKLYGNYKDRLYRYALYRLGDPTEAEDAVSDCVLAAWQGIGSLRSGSAFSAQGRRAQYSIAQHNRRTEQHGDIIAYRPGCRKCKVKAVKKPRKDA